MNRRTALFRNALARRPCPALLTPGWAVVRAFAYAVTMALVAGVASWVYFAIH